MRRDTEAVQLLCELSRRWRLRRDAYEEVLPGKMKIREEKSMPWNETLRMSERTIVEGAGAAEYPRLKSRSDSRTLPDLHRISYTQNLPIRQ
jgi:hypothetical protein